MIKVNLDNLTIGDLEKFEAWGSGSAKMSEVLPLLERIVESEKPVRDMPYKELRNILDAIKDAIEDVSNPKN